MGCIPSGMVPETSMSKTTRKEDSDRQKISRELETPLESACHLLYLAGHIDTKAEDRQRHIRGAEEHLQHMAGVLKRWNC
jgi:hypothetical protein